MFISTTFPIMLSSLAGLARNRSAFPASHSLPASLASGWEWSFRSAGENSKYGCSSRIQNFPSSNSWMRTASWTCAAERLMAWQQQHCGDRLSSFSDVLKMLWMHSVQYTCGQGARRMPPDERSSPQAVQGNVKSRANAAGKSECESD